MKTKEEIREWLLDNAVDEYGDLDLSGLDFSDFEVDVYISNMKVQGNLFQSGQEVQGSLDQCGQKVQGHLYNKNNKYGEYLYEEPSTKLLKEITLKELAELGYTLKGE